MERGMDTGRRERGFELVDGMIREDLTEKVLFK